MSNHAFLVCAVLLAGSAVSASQTASEDPVLTPRQLFFTKTPKQPTPTPTRRTPARDEEGAFLGLRYSLLLLNAAGRADEVDPDNVFHKGDRIRLRLLGSQGGYLYVVHQGSSGNWEILVPDAEHPTPRAQPFRPVEVPGEDCFEFDDTPGNERLFIVLSKTPEPSLEGLLDSVRKRQTGPASRPRPDAPDKGSVNLAMNRPAVTTGDLDKVRSQLAPRDLRVQKVQRTQGDRDSENAVYVVNASTAGNRVIAEIVIQHR